MGLEKSVILSFFLVNIRFCPHQVAPPVKIMLRPFFHERGIACGTTCEKMPKAKMDTLKNLIIISHPYCFFLMKNGIQLKLPLKGISQTHQEHRRKNTEEENIEEQP